ncbi:hypothetical protein OC834_006605 [Tilletia horrida]|nr:hypothetical protein OC834_006605 [Tilletia horrida]
MAAVASGTLPLKIEVVSDNICPFCFIGWRKLERALAASPYVAGSQARNAQGTKPTFTPQIEFKPFQLDPTLPTDSALDKRQHYLRKFGPRFNQMEPMMKMRGSEVGINFVYDGPLRNTTLSHRLMEKAFEQGGWDQQRKLLDELFPAYFEKSQDIGDPATLARLSVTSGLFATEAEAQVFLSSDEFADEVERAYREAQAKNISGVPHFTISALRPDDEVAAASPTFRPFLRSVVSGAQEPETFVTLIETMAKKAAEKGFVGADGGPAGVAVDDAKGDSCALDGSKTC